MQKVETKNKIIAISQINREIVECVIRAACEYYDITREQLIGERKLSEMRRYCYYIIWTNCDGLFDYSIGQFFNKKRTAVQYGIDLVDHQKHIYRQTLGTLNSIIQIANNFEKKYQWDLQSINITS